MLFIMLESYFCSLMNYLASLVAVRRYRVTNKMLLHPCFGKFKKKKKREKKCGCRTIQQLWEEDFLLYKFCWCLAHSQQWCIFSTLCVQSLMNAMLLKSLNVKNLKPRFSEQSRKVGEDIWEKEKEYEMTEQ